MAESDVADQATGASRRAVLRGAVAVGVGLPFLAACGGDTSTPGAASSSDSSGGDTSSGGSDTGGGSGVIATVGDVPEGGGIILDDPKVVITQPAAGEFKGFSSICTHQGCPLDNVTNGTMNCTCHGSMFSIDDGSVVGGPAPAPLPEQKITVKGDNISLSS